MQCRQQTPSSPNPHWGCWASYLSQTVSTLPPLWFASTSATALSVDRSIDYLSLILKNFSFVQLEFRAAVENTASFQITTWFLKTIRSGRLARAYV
jgi:hypothetical protein